MLRVALVLLLSGGLFAAEDAKPVAADFEDAKVGEVPKGWTVTKTGTDDASKWLVVEDKDAPKGAKALAQVFESPRPMFNLCVLDATSFKDVEVSVAFKAVKGQDDQGGGVVWRYKDANNYYVARHNPLEKNFRLYKIENGKRSQLATTKDDVDAPAGKWHTLSVTMKGDAITCSLNGKKVIDAKDATFADAGKVGLWTKADAHTYFDDFRATAK